MEYHIQVKDAGLCLYSSQGKSIGKYMKTE